MNSEEFHGCLFDLLGPDDTNMHSASGCMILYFLAFSTLIYLALSRTDISKDWLFHGLIIVNVIWVLIVVFRK